MELKTIASGSSGNSYTLSTSHGTLILEAGMNPKKVQRTYGFNITKAIGCLISHEHGDHSKYVKQYLNKTIDCYATAGTIKALGLKRHHRLHQVEYQKKFQIGGYKIMPFRTIHDAEEPCGYLIGTQDQTIVFATDTSYIPYSFPKATVLMVECNYSLKMLKQKITNGEVHKSAIMRLRHTHQSIDRLIKFLKKQDTSRLKAIHLLHISSRNGDVVEFKEKIKKVIPRETQLIMGKE